MLTDTKLRNLKPKDKLYKVNGRDGLYVAVTAAGAISFRYNYETFGAWAEKWLRGYQMADSTRDMRRSVYERELKPKFSNQKLV
ncbi:Arm DNA-binding domain-containing protein, partial [Xanthomonas hortorum pv. vitians]